MTGNKVRKGVVFIGVDGNEPQVFEFDTTEYIDHFAAVRDTYKELYEKEKTVHIV